MLFEILFWAGMRIGEVLAITKNDVDFQENKISVSKTYYRTEGKDVIITSKTEQSVRTIDISEFLTQEIKRIVISCMNFLTAKGFFQLYARRCSIKW